MYKANIGFSAEAGSEDKSFSTYEEAISYANDRALYYKRNNHSISGEWKVYNEDNPLECTRSGELKTDYEIVKGRFNNG